MEVDFNLQVVINVLNNEHKVTKKEEIITYIIDKGKAKAWLNDNMTRLRSAALLLVI